MYFISTLFTVKQTGIEHIHHCVDYRVGTVDEDGPTPFYYFIKLVDNA